MKVLSEADVELLRAMANEYRKTRYRPGLEQPRLHRAGDIVRVKVEVEIPPRSPTFDPDTDPPPTVEVVVWDVLRDEPQNYSIDVIKIPDVTVAVGMHYAAIDRDGVWAILSAGVPTEALGLVAANFYGSPVSFQVEVTDFLDFPSQLPSGPITVVNRYNWESGEMGAPIHIRHRRINNTWIPVQMEWDCDTEVGPE